VSLKFSHNYIFILLYPQTMFGGYGVSDCCLTPTQLFFSYIMARTS